MQDATHEMDHQQLDILDRKAQHLAATAVGEALEQGVGESGIVDVMVVRFIRMAKKAFARGAGLATKIGTEMVKSSGNVSVSGKSIAEKMTVERDGTIEISRSKSENSPLFAQIRATQQELRPLLPLPSPYQLHHRTTIPIVVAIDRVLRALSRVDELRARLFHRVSLQT